MFDFTALNEITAKLRKEIKKSFTENINIYELWFEEMSVERMTDMLLFISVKTDMQKLTIENKYLHIVSDAVKKVYGLDLRVVVYCTMYGKVTKAQIDKDEKSILLEGIDDEAIKSAAKRNASNPAPVYFNNHRMPKNYGDLLEDELEDDREETLKDFRA